MSGAPLTPAVPETTSSRSGSMVPEVVAGTGEDRRIEAPELGAQVLLAIDTTLGTNVALGVDGAVFEAASDDPRGHAEAIGGLVARVFERAGVSPRRVTGVVAGIGPGPFTGLRVGVAAAHAFAAGRGVPVYPVQGPEAVALAVLSEGAAVPSLRVIQDARRRELFVTEYAGLDWMGIPNRTSEPRLLTRADHRDESRDVWPERIPAARLVQLAARRLATGRKFEPDRALYLRDPDVYPSAKPKRVST